VSNARNRYETGLEKKDRSILASAISALENDRSDAPDVVAAVYGRTGHAHVIGVTGPPGAGKSTLIAALIGEFRQSDQTVAVVAVDPSSPFGGGAILGDRIRMSDHALDTGVFVRSVATRGNLGGLSRATGQIVDVLDSFGFDVVIVETVGAGQAEIDIMHLAQTVVVVAAPGFGSGVQAVKAGVLEIADIFVVNKADTPMAAAAERDLHEALGPPSKSGWRQPIIPTVAIDRRGVQELLEKLNEHRAQLDPEDRVRAATIRCRTQLASAVAELASGRVVDHACVDDLTDQLLSGQLGLAVAARAALKLISSPDATN